MDDARLSNEPINEMDRLVQATREALTDSMVERLAITFANAAELVDRLNDEQTREAVHAVVDRLTELHKVGALDTLFDAVMLLHAARNASTDSIVERLFGFVEQMINTVGNEAMGTLADNARQSLDEAAEESARTNPRGGILTTLSLLARPESQRSLMFLLAFGEKLQRRTASA
ncbi:MAG TPA: hypothetical protein VGU20_16045 [Stellaceae bacterium]|nr:hypothetical protein [Stellaceae bacterium]